VYGIESEVLGVIAGNGPLPVIVLKNLKAKGLKLFVAAHVGETSEEGLALADTTCWVKPGQLGTLLELFKTHGVGQALFAGGMKKAALVRTFEPDKDALKFIETLPNLHDDTILRALAQKGCSIPLLASTYPGSADARAFVGGRNPSSCRAACA
jgi:DUF1009 family protein